MFRNFWVAVLGRHVPNLQIFGASGAVGRCLLTRILDREEEVVACSRAPDAADLVRGAGIHWRHADLWRDRGHTGARSILSAGPLGGLVDWLERVETPVLTRVVALGSMSIDSKQAAEDPRERAVAGQLAEAEQRLFALAEQRGFAATVLRPTLIWGGGRDRSLTPLFRRARLLRLLPLPREPGGQRQPVHADDVASACLHALDRPGSAQHSIELGGGECLSVREMWRRVMAAAGALPLPLTLAAYRRLAALPMIGSSALVNALSRWPQDQTAEPEAAHRLLGHAPRDFAPTAADFLR